MPKYISRVPIKFVHQIPQIPKYIPAELQAAANFFNKCDTKLGQIVSSDGQSEFKSRLPEVMFLGASNVGKSSIITSLMTDSKQRANSQKEFARVSSKPGHTRSLNFYTCGRKLRVVDTPGYGKASQVSQGTLIQSYLESQRSLKRAYVLVNAGKGIKDSDRAVFDMLAQYGIPWQVVLTQCDRFFKRYDDAVPSRQLNRRAGQKVRVIRDRDVARLNESTGQVFEDLVQLASTAESLGGNASLFEELLITSTETGAGIPELRAAVWRACGFSS